MTIAVRGAGRADLPTLAALMQEFYSESGMSLPVRSASSAFEQLLANPQLGRAWLVEWEGDVAGYIVLTFGYSMEYGGVRVVIDDFFIRPALRGRGLGTSALATARGACTEQGARALVAEVGSEDELARRFYEESGFADTGNRLMALPLAPPVHITPLGDESHGPGSGR